MVRSIWKKTLVASLAWASFAWAQSPATPANLALPEPVPATSPERTMTVQETGKAGQKCKVMKTWQTPEGATAYQVQGLETGEIMTIVESGPITSTAGSQPGTRLNAVATRIFHFFPFSPGEGCYQAVGAIIIISIQSVARPTEDEPWIS